MEINCGLVRYVQAPNAIERLCDALRGVQSVFVLGGVRALQAFMPRFALPGAHVRAEAVYNPSTSWTACRELAAVAAGCQAQAVVGTGGGVALDMAKAVAEQAGLPLFLSPGQCATCACATTYIALYDQDGRRTGKALYSRPILGVYADERVLAAAPRRTLAAGIAGGLAALSAAASASLYPDNPSSVRWEHQMAQAEHLCDQYYAYASDALQGEADALRHIWYANLYLAGLTAATGCERRVGALARHFYDSVCCLYPQERLEWLYGEHVGVGVLMEMQLTGAISGFTVKSMRVFLRDVLRCPICLSDLGLPDHPQARQALARAIALRSGLPEARVGQGLNAI